MGWHFAAAAQGIGVGMLTTLLFTLPPLLAIRKIRPAMILRRDMPEAKLPLARSGWSKRAGALVAGGVILIGIGGDRGVARGFARASADISPVDSRPAWSRWRLVAWLLLRALREFLQRIAVADSVAGAAGDGESVPAGQSGAGDSGGARAGRDVHADGLHGAGFAGGADHRNRAAGRAQRFSGRRHAGAGGAVEGSDRAIRTASLAALEFVPRVAARLVSVNGEAAAAALSL